METEYNYYMFEQYLRSKHYEINVLKIHGIYSKIINTLILITARHNLLSHLYFLTFPSNLELYPHVIVP